MVGFLMTGNWAMHNPVKTLKFYDYDPKGSKPAGKDWTFLIEDWCRWLISQPKDTNPCNDKTGEFTMKANDAYKSDVYYLAGATGGKFERRCTLKSKPIFFPVVVDEESTAELPYLLDSKTSVPKPGFDNILLKKCVEDQDKIISLEATIDKGTPNEVAFLTGTLVKNRIKTDSPFDLDFQNDNLWDAMPIKSKAMADGYWIFIQPPEPNSQHTIYFHAVEDDFEIEVMHYLTVQ
jgi:hypothetical protein